MYSKRQIRREHIERLKNKRQYYWGYPYKWPDKLQFMDPRQLGIVVNTPKVYCKCCKNLRKYYGPTLQEKRYFCNSVEDD